jgi:hypothetical protein
MVRKEQFVVALEIGPRRRVFAQALAWIGWCRAGKDEATALHQLVAASLRYTQVAGQAGFTFVAPSSIEAFEVVERWHALDHAWELQDRRRTCPINTFQLAQEAPSLPAPPIAAHCARQRSQTQ